MNKQHLQSTSMNSILHEMVKKYELTEHQLSQFQSYLTLLIDWNEKFNLTALVEPLDVVFYHFLDSLSLIEAVEGNVIHALCDVRTGAGFPGIPLKIMYPDLNLVLIEVNGKKRLFLEHIIRVLGLRDVIIYAQDWRTFLRKTHYSVEYVCARASLQPEELVRMLTSESPYKKATLVYWASLDWRANKHVSHYMHKEFAYEVGTKKRKLVFFTIQDK